MTTDRSKTRTKALSPQSVEGPVDAVSEGWLPQQVTTFVGRAGEVADLTGRLSASRLVTLTGPSGIGKTRLALEVASQLEASYPGGAWMVDLAPVADPELVARALAAALHLPPEPGLDSVEVLITHLRSQQALLVLDNCEQVLEACAGLTETLLEAAPGVTILATTQRALGVKGEEVLSVSPMSLPDPRAGDTAEAALRSEAVRLFCSRAQAHSASFTFTNEVAAAVVEICLHLEGIPLAVELAAARAAVLTPAEIAERLDDCFRLLTRGPDDAPHRHETLRAALDWSYDLLSPAEAALLRRLSVFSGGASLRAVEEVCSGGEVNRADVLDLVSELVSRSLLTADTSGPRARYRMLETVRDYASRRLAESGELDAQRTRHAEWCLALVERSSHLLLANDQFWMATIDSELDNIRAGLQWAVTQEPKLGLRMAVAVAQVWKIRGQLSEGQSWLERALQANPAAPGSLRARALWSIGMLAVLQGDATIATQAVEKSLALARAGGLRRAEAQALNLLGFISIFTQDPLAAMPLLEESVGLARAANEPSLLVNALVLYGRAHLYLGAPDAARRVFEECLQLTGSDGDQADSSLAGLGWAAWIAGDHQEAEELFRRALSMLRRDAESFETAMVLSFLGELAWARGDMIEARALLDEGLALARDMGAPFPRVRCQATLARVALFEGDLPTAQFLADDSCARATRFPLPYAHVRCLHVQGLVRLAAGDASGAQVSFDQALAIARDNLDEAGTAASIHHLARLARARGNSDRSASLHADALAIQTRIPDTAGIAGSLESLAGLAVAKGRHPHAARLFGAAQLIRDEEGSPRPPDEAVGYETDVARLRAEAAGPVLEEAWAHGLGLRLDEAVALATKGRGARDRPVMGWAALTPAERQVADLAAAGLTNNEIGAKLFLSGRTVQGHLLRIFPKLGVHSRRQLRDLDRDS